MQALTEVAVVILLYWILLTDSLDYSWLACFYEGNT